MIPQTDPCVAVIISVSLHRNTFYGIELQINSIAVNGVFGLSALYQRSRSRSIRQRYDRVSNHGFLDRVSVVVFRNSGNFGRPTRTAPDKPPTQISKRRNREALTPSTPTAKTHKIQLLFPNMNRSSPPRHQHSSRGDLITSQPPVRRFPLRAAVRR